MTRQAIEQFITKQLTTWPLAGNNHKALSGIVDRRFIINRQRLLLQHNPARHTSSSAKVDASSIAARPCFLCMHNQPPQQGRMAWHDYHILVNPYPIFPGHLTIVHRTHQPQRIVGHIADMTALSAELEGYTVFYNGPACGASAPDHLHFQAVPSEYLPIWEAIDNATAIAHISDSASIFDIVPPLIFTETSTAMESAGIIGEIIARLPSDDNDEEPKVNMLMRSTRGSTQSIIVPRLRHRPYNFGETADKILISPASIDMGGVIIAPRKTDFTELTGNDIAAIFNQVCFTASQLKQIFEL